MCVREQTWVACFANRNPPSSSRPDFPAPTFRWHPCLTAYLPHLVQATSSFLLPRESFAKLESTLDRHPPLTSTTAVQGLGLCGETSFVSIGSFRATQLEIRALGWHIAV